MLCPDMGVFEDQSERTVSVSWGEAAVLDLPSLLSHPQPLVIWQADDGTQLYGRKYALTDRHQLIILSVTDSDQKAYRWVLRCLPRSVFLMKLLILRQGTHSQISSQGVETLYDTLHYGSGGSVPVFQWSVLGCRFHLYL